jgi:GntR family transcriptional regulator
VNGSFMEDATHRRIDFDSHIPYYAQLIEIIRDIIESEKLKPGDQLPSEPELCETYGISRTVVRHALSDLEFEGLIVRRKGKGTFVAGPKINESLVQKLTGFYHDMVERGLTPITQVLSQEIIGATAMLAHRLEIEEGSEVFCLERLRFLDDEPIVLVKAFLPYALCRGIEEIDFSRRSLYDTLEERFGLHIARGHRTIEAVAADERQAKLLSINPGDPVNLLESVTYLENGMPVEYYQAVHRGDRTRFEVELFRIPSRQNLGDAIKKTNHELPHSN